jgi:hypothetical protein
MSRGTRATAAVARSVQERAMRAISRSWAAPAPGRDTGISHKEEDHPTMNLLPRPFGLRAFGRLSLLLLACAALYLYAAHSAGRKELRALCEQGVEPKVYRKVSADGYFNSEEQCYGAGCWRMITESEYRYVEIEQRGAKHYSPIPDAGFYRLSKETLDSGKCFSTAKDQLEDSAFGRRFLAHGYCIAVERIQMPTSEFGIYSERGPEISLDNIFDSKILPVRTYIKEVRSDAIVAERTSYILFQNALPSFSSFAVAIGCPDVGVNQVKSDIVNVEVYIVPK